MRLCSLEWIRRLFHFPRRLPMPTDTHCPEEKQIIHTLRMLNSFRRFVGYELIPRESNSEHEARTLFEAPFVVVSHGIQADPILNYGNRMALELWEMDFETLTSIPSRLTAEPLHRDERALLMARAERDGFVDDYRGVRISSSGKRFVIEQAIVWNVIDEEGQRVGQAATFLQWTPIV